MAPPKVFAAIIRLASAVNIAAIGRSSPSKPRVITKNTVARAYPLSTCLGLSIYTLPNIYVRTNFPQRIYIEVRPKYSFSFVGEPFSCFMLHASYCTFKTCLY